MSGLRAIWLPVLPPDLGHHSSLERPAYLAVVHLLAKDCFLSVCVVNSSIHTEVDTSHC